MNWGQLAALSLDPNRRGMSGMGCFGLAGKKPWKKIGISKSAYKAGLVEKRGLFEAQFTDMTREQGRAEITRLQAAMADAKTKSEKASLLQSIKAAKKAKRRITKQKEWYAPSVTEGVDDPAYTDVGEGSDEGPPPEDTWNTDQNGSPTPADQRWPPDGVKTALTPAPVSGGGSTINFTSPGDFGPSGPTTGMTMWDTVLNVTGGNKTVLLAGAGVLAYLFFFRKKR